jgi:hypothetical protein
MLRLVVVFSVLGLAACETAPSAPVAGYAPTYAPAPAYAPVYAAPMTGRGAVLSAIANYGNPNQPVVMPYGDGNDRPVMCSPTGTTGVICY